MTQPSLMETEMVNVTQKNILVLRSHWVQGIITPEECEIIMTNFAEKMAVKVLGWYNSLTGSDLTELISFCLEKEAEGQAFDTAMYHYWIDNVVNKSA